MKCIANFLWPTIGNLSPAEIKKDEADFARDIEAIDAADWSVASDTALGEARRMYEEEEERRRVADSKATNYLTVAVALMSLLTFFEGVVWGEKIGSAPRWLTFSLLTLALIYTVAFGYWAFAALKLKGYHRTGPTELAELALRRKPNHGHYLVRYLKCTRANQRVNNDRLSYMNMAHRFLFRVFVLFGAVVIIESASGAYDAVFSKAESHKPPASEFNRNFLLDV